MADAQQPAPPLPVHLINLTLQYLLPPTAPLPIHLLSKDLLQRHHFLRITPDVPEEYFCWPTFPSSAASIIQDLEFRAGNEALLNKEQHDITYEHDEEGSRARVRLSDELDLYIMFVWQGSDEPGSGGEAGWRYYDIKRLPITPSHHAVASEPKGETQPMTIINQHDLDSPELSGGAYTRSSSPSSDAYWDNYGASSSRNSPSQPTIALPANGRTEAEEEAAYWAAYSVVQGTADSTIPSRVPSSRKLGGLNPYMNDEERSARDPYAFAGDYEHPHSPVYGEEHIVMSHERPSRWALHDDAEDHEDDEDGERDWDGGRVRGWNPPRSFARADNDEAPGITFPPPDADERVLRRFSPPLSTESERERRKSEERDATDATALARALFPVVSYQEHLESLHSSDADSNHAEQEAEAEALAETEHDGGPSSSQSTAAETKPPSIAGAAEGKPLLECLIEDPETDSAVSEAVRGVYKLWLAQTQSSPTRKDSTTPVPLSSTKEAFLALVAKAISSSSV